MRVLFLTRPSNFVHQIAREMGLRNRDFYASVIEEGYAMDDKSERIYENVVRSRFSIRSFIFFLRKFPLFFVLMLQSLLLIFLDLKQGLKSGRCVFDAFMYITKIQHANLNKFKIINVHYCNLTRSIAILFLPKKSYVVMSFWGSDLFRTSGLSNNYWMRKALNRTNVIHLASFEMREALLAEFGYILKPKIKYALFLPDFNLVRLIDENKSSTSKLANFKMSLNIAENNVCIMIGNNGNIGNNHLQILKEIENIKEMDEVTILLPLTYGLTPDYEESIDDFIQNTTLKIVCFKKFLSWEDLACLRIVSDVFITMQETDAMSATLTEILYAGNLAIAASWLPYGRFRESGAYFLECNGFNLLGKMVLDVLNNMEAYKLKCKHNSKAIETYFYDKEKLVSSWQDLYN